MSTSQKEREVLRRFLDWANGEPTPLLIPVGDRYRLFGEAGLRKDNRPVVAYNWLKPPHEWDWKRAHDVAIQLLEALSVNDSCGVDSLEAETNARGLHVLLYSYAPGGRTWKGNRIIRGDRGGPGQMVPIASTSEDIPYAVLAVARCSPTGQGDSLADRISRCLWCGRFFLLRTRKHSDFCAKECRWKSSNRRRAQAGVFRTGAAQRRLASRRRQQRAKAPG